VLDQSKKFPLLIVVRHGQTDFNLQKRFQGHLPVSLNETGQMQAARSGALLGNVVGPLIEYGAVLGNILTSDLLRATETAEILSSVVRKQSDLDLNFVTDPNLREYHNGELAGMTLKEHEELRSGVFQEYLDEFDREPDEARFPGKGSESKNMVASRVLPLLNDILLKNEPKIHSLPEYGAENWKQAVERNPFSSAVSHFRIENVEVHVWCTHGGILETLFELLNADRRGNHSYIRNGDLVLLAPLLRYPLLPEGHAKGKGSEYPFPGTLFPGAFSRRHGCDIAWRIVRHYQVT